MGYERAMAPEPSTVTVTLFGGPVDGHKYAVPAPSPPQLHVPMSTPDGYKHAVYVRALGSRDIYRFARYNKIKME